MLTPTLDTAHKYYITKNVHGLAKLKKEIERCIKAPFREQPTSENCFNMALHERELHITLAYIKKITGRN